MLSARKRRNKIKAGRWDHCPEARQDGRDAYDKHVAPKNNPYTKGCAEHREWLRGFRSAKHDANQIPKEGTLREERMMHKHDVG